MGKVIGMSPNIGDFMVGTVESIRQTDKAILVVILDGPHEDKEVWVPLSVISPNSEVVDCSDYRGLLVVYKWWATANHLDDD